MKNKIYLFLILGSIVLCSCKEEVSSDIVFSEEELLEKNNFEKQEWTIKKGEVLSSDIRKYGDLMVGVKYVSALDFIKKTGRNIDENNRESLKKETVFIMEFKSINQQQRNPLNLKQCNVSFEEGVKFLAFELEKNIKVIQNDSIFLSNGSHFERDFSLSDRLRVITFFKGIDRTKDFKFIFQDDIFGGENQEFIFSQYLNYTENS